MKTTASRSITSLNACTNPIVESGEKQRRIISSNPRLDPNTFRDSNGFRFLLCDERGLLHSL